MRICRAGRRGGSCSRTSFGTATAEGRIRARARLTIATMVQTLPIHLEQVSGTQPRSRHDFRRKGSYVGGSAISQPTSAPKAMITT
jgi:hypothetical protein